MSRVQKNIISAFLCVVLLVTTITGISNTAWAGTKQAEITVVYSQAEARRMFSMINNFRLSDPWAWNENDTQKIVYTGLSSLEYDYDLEKIAMKRAAELAISYSHTRPNGERCFTAYDEISSNRYMAKGENIAYGYNCFKSSEEVFEAWAEEDEYYSGQGHRRNMISSNYTAVGIGYARYDGKEFWCQEFGSPKSNAVDSGANTYATKVQIEVPDTLTVVDKGVTQK